MRRPGGSTGEDSGQSTPAMIGRAARSTTARAALAVFSRAAAVAVVVCAAAGPALAHGGALGSAAGTSLSVPPWLAAVAGVVAVGASVLAGATGHPPVGRLRAVRWRVRLPAGRALRTTGRLLGVVGLVGVVTVGLVGPADPLSNAATVVVWVGWWAGYAMTTYLVGNSWPAINPWRTLSRALPEVGREYEWRYGAWGSLAGLLGLVWLEVVGPLADRPRTLAVTVLAYSTVTLAGAAVYGTESWFGSVDPVAGVFRRLGRVAPVETDGSGRLSVRLPGATLADEGLVDGVDEVAFVVGLLWAITFDGFVTTPLWEAIVTPAVRTGVPPAAVYPLGLLAGYVLFLGLYLLAARGAAMTGGAGVDTQALAEGFAPALLPIAAGAHLVHFLGYFVALTPPLLATVSAPLTPVVAPVLVVPDAVGFAAFAAVVVGHLLALEVTRATAGDLCSDRTLSVRTALPFVAVLTCYTLVTLWTVTRPANAPPFL